MFESQNKTEKNPEANLKDAEKQGILKMTRVRLSDLRKELDGEKDGSITNTEEMKTIRAKGTPREYRKTTKNKHIVWENGDYLKGSVIEGKWTGYGRYTLGENIHYEGNFVNSQFEGKGVYSYGKPGQIDWFKLDCEWKAGVPQEGGDFSYFDPNTKETAETTSLYFIFKWPEGSFYPLNMSRLVYESAEVGPKGDPFYLKELADGSEVIFRRDKTTEGNPKEKTNPSFDDTEVIVLPQGLSADFKSSLLQEMNSYYKTHVILFNKGE